MIPKKYVAAVVAGLSIAIGAWLASDPFARGTASTWSSTRALPSATTEPQPTRGKVRIPRLFALGCALCR